MGLLEDLLESILLIFQSSEIWGIAALSFFVSVTAVTLASIIGIPLGIWLGLRSSNSKLVPVSLLNTGMGLPPVLVGLVVFLLLTRQGPLGALELLFTPLAMIIGQMILTLPILIGITRSTILDMPEELPEMLLSLGSTRIQMIRQIMLEARSGMLVAVIVALGRAFSEVGAILILGGNIRYRTRVLTTAIITEISRGERPTALALGLLLLLISFSLTTFVTYIQLTRSRE